jgi:SAM-dependent methyltransferase
VTWFARLYLWATYRLYYEFAWAYDLAAWLVSLGRWAGWRSSALSYVKGERVLEVGFGTGELLAEMAGQGLRVVGLELSMPMHRRTARKLARKGLAVPRVRAAVQDAPFAEGCFDAIVSTFPAGYILEAASLREMARLLRRPDPVLGAEGGRLIVVGLFMRWENRFWNWVMGLLFGEQEGVALERFGRVSQRAGLRVTVIDPGGHGLRAPVVLAERV